MKLSPKLPSAIALFILLVSCGSPEKSSESLDNKIIDYQAGELSHTWELHLKKLGPSTPQEDPGTRLCLNRTLVDWLWAYRSQIKPEILRNLSPENQLLKLERQREAFGLSLIQIMGAEPSILGIMERLRADNQMPPPPQALDLAQSEAKALEFGQTLSACFNQSIKRESERIAQNL